MFQHPAKKRHVRIEFATREINASEIFTMRELNEADLDAATDKLYKAKENISVIDHQESGPFDFYIVMSGVEKIYEVTRLGWFAKCTCPDFKYSGPCKHIVVCLPVVCRKCFVRPVPQRGKTCGRCEQDNAIYLKPTREFQSTIVGKIRV